MVGALMLIIQRKTKVPTKRQIRHLYRSDWKKVYRIEYDMSPRFFKYINGKGMFETDAQFCKWLYETFGEGTYLLIAFQKGIRGFRNFMKVEVKKEGFKRLKKSITLEEKELRREKLEIERKKRKNEKIGEDATEYAELLKSFVKLDKEKKHGCSPFLKSIHPIYSFHSYEEYKQECSGVESRKRLI